MASRRSLSPDRRKVHSRLTLEEREMLQSVQEARYTAFTPRPETRLAMQKSPTTDSKILLNHRLRTFRDESTIIYPLDSYKTWVDAGHLEPLVPEAPDPNYNSNVWRNFSSNEGSQYAPERRKVSSVVASMYPLSIPPPSRMGDFTYARFIRHGDIYRDPVMKKKRITWTEKELQEMKHLSVLTDARVPPTDDKGRIIPPVYFRRLKAQGRIRHIPMKISTRLDAEPQPDLFKNLLPEKLSDTASLASRNTSLRHKGLLWKFSYKLNNPEYHKVKEAQLENERWKMQNSKVRELRKQALQQQVLATY